VVLNRECRVVRLKHKAYYFLVPILKQMVNAIYHPLKATDGKKLFCTGENGSEFLEEYYLFLSVARSTSSFLDFWLGRSNRTLGIFTNNMATKMTKAVPCLHTQHYTVLFRFSFVGKR